MSDQPQAVAQEKKKPTDPSRRESYTEKVTIRQWDAGGKRFGVNPIKNVPAFRRELRGKPAIFTLALPAAAPTKGSEIIEADGTVWIVEECKPGGNHYLNYVKKKDAPKKPK